MSHRSDQHGRPTDDMSARKPDLQETSLVQRSLASSAPLTERRSLRGLGTALIGLSCLTVAVTGSAIAWQHFEHGPAPVVTAVASVDPAEVEALRRQLVLMADDTFALRAELDALTGPSGVLPRVIEQLQNGRRADASHAAVLQQLLEVNLTQISDIIFENESAQSRQGRGPIQVSPLQSSLSEPPRRVIVTPQVGDLAHSVEQGQ